MLKDRTAMYLKNIFVQGFSIHHEGTDYLMSVLKKCSIKKKKHAVIFAAFGLSSIHAFSMFIEKSRVVKRHLPYFNV